MSTQVQALQAKVEQLQREKEEHLPSSREAIELSRKIRGYEAILTMPGFLSYVSRGQAA